MSADITNKVNTESSTVDVVPLVEEQAHVSKRESVTGRVRVRTYTDVVEDVVQEALESVRAEVERCALDIVLDVGAAVPQTRTEGEYTIIPLVEEVVFVEKRLVLKEEIRVRRLSSIEAAEVHVPLRKQRAVIDQDAPENEAK